MRRWIWRVLLIVAATAALMGTAAAEEVRYPATGSNSIRYDLDTKTVLGPVNKASITNAKIPAKVNGTEITTIAPGAFDSCGILRTVEISEKLTTIGKGAFNGCSQLNTVYFSQKSSLTTIEEDAFAGCTQLNNVILPDQLTSIKAGTFDGCTGLTAIYIPTSVLNIEADAFYLDTNLKILHYGGSDTTQLKQEDKVPRAVHYSRMREPTESLAPTCTAEGKEIVTIGCGECGRVLITQERAIPALGHIPGEEIAEVAATCVKGGTTAGHRCSREGCGGIADGVVPTPKEPTNHSKIVDIPKVNATCTEKGSENGKKCQGCGKTTTEPTEIPALDHNYVGCELEKKTLKVPTCTEKGQEFTYKICTRCNETEVCEDCVKLAADATKRTEYEEHLKTDHGLKEVDALGHTKGEAGYVVTTKPACTTAGEESWRYTCTVCGEVLTDLLPPDADEHEPRPLPATGHTPHTLEENKDDPEYKEATCTEDGLIVYKKTTCTVCGEEYVPKRPVASGGGHKYEDVEKEIIKEATCSETGLEKVGAKKCSVCGNEVPAIEQVIPRKAHTWGDPEEDESKEDVPATCGEPGKSFVIVTCSVCNTTEHQEIEIPATGQHNWGKWTTKEPTETQEGYQVRTCGTCQKEDKIIFPATGAPSGPDDPDDPDDPDKPEPTYLVNLVQGAGGSVIANTNSAASGDRVTLTTRAESGYELDMVRVISASGGVLSLTELGGGQYRFTMPASNVEVRVTFQRKSTGSAWSSAWASAPGDGSDGNPRRTTDPMPTQNPAQSVPRAGTSGQLFQDIPASHWASGEISWANQMGYMNGSAGRFNPDGTITHQQMWMVLARLTGSRPANMTEARRWAVENSFADGSSPDGAVARHQLVTALYRCAHLMGSSNRNTTSLAGYADSRTVPAVARDAFSWAVANGIVGGTANGRLNPNGTLTRAQFAVILYRYSQRI